MYVFSLIILFHIVRPKTFITNLKFCLFLTYIADFFYIRPFLGFVRVEMAMK